MEDRLNIELFREYFGPQKLITTQEIFEFYRSIDPLIVKSTINWKVYELDKSGIISRKARGVFSLGRGVIYKPQISLNLKKIYKKTRMNFPLVKICVWNTSFINEFAHHQLNLNYNIIEIERSYLESVYLQIKDEITPSIFRPQSINLDNLSLKSKNINIFLPLISEAPIQKIEGISAITLEKLLVDLYSDNLWESLKGNELVRIYKNALNKYSVNYSKLLRYASRKGKKEEIGDFLTKNDLNISDIKGGNI